MTDDAQLLEGAVLGKKRFVQTCIQEGISKGES